MNDKEWRKHLEEEWEQDIEEGCLTIEEILSWWPSKKEYDEFEVHAKRLSLSFNLQEKIKQHFFDEDEYEKLIKSFNRSEPQAIKLILSYLPGVKKIECLDLLKDYTPYSKAEKKIYRSFRQTLRNKDFNNDIKKIRKKFEIPEKGFDWTEESKEWFKKNSLSTTTYEDIKKTRRKYKFESISISAITQYLFFNLVSTDYMMISDSFCYVSDRTSDTEGYKIADFDYLDDIEERKRMVNYLKKNDIERMKAYPVSINVSPYATISDISTFIRENSKQIKEIQNIYKESNVNIGAINLRLTNKKYDYIWENQHIKPARELAQLVNVNFRTKHDEIYIRNIVSRENKRRGKP